MKSLVFQWEFDHRKNIFTFLSIFVEMVLRVGIIARVRQGEDY